MISCRQDQRRDAVRRKRGWNGLDYVEVLAEDKELHVYFLGKLPAELAQGGASAARHLSIEGGVSVTGLVVTGARPVVDPDPEKDDALVVLLDRRGDASTYTLRLQEIEHLDPRFDHLDFSFQVDCPSDLDCGQPCRCEPPELSEPSISYLAKDYASFRQLVLDRMSTVMPDWKERHVPDLGIALAELLAYVGDDLSYFQDAVATEAYLTTARQRISVRRHARLVDYRLSEGCNARAWVQLQVSSDWSLEPGRASFATALPESVAGPGATLLREDLRNVPRTTYEVFEPMVEDRTQAIALREAHNEISFYTWGDSRCCLEKGSTRATLRDRWVAPVGGDDVANAEGRALSLAVGDVLIFEEVLGPHTGNAADADPTHRHAVRLVRVTPAEDAVITDANGASTPIVEIEWSHDDALPFPLCLSSRSDVPDCAALEDVSVARGNVVLVDHGETWTEDLGTVPTSRTEADCECIGRPGETRRVPGPFAPMLRRKPITFSAGLAARRCSGSSIPSATSCLIQDPREALPKVWLRSKPSRPWKVKNDLVASAPADWHFVVEVDNDGFGHLRFGDGTLGASLPAGMSFKRTRYRVGNGAAGNVGAEAIAHLVMTDERLSGITITVRNPLPARGGIDPESIAEAKLRAPYVFRNTIERAVVAADYETILARDPEVQRASARLSWNGSWYEADVSIDRLERTGEADDLERQTACLERYRRMGHDLRVRAVEYVPLVLVLKVCVLADVLRAHVQATLLERFGTRRTSDGKLGFFHPDRLTFGEGIALSRIVSLAQSVPGVAWVEVEELRRQFEPAGDEQESGRLALAPWEIARLDNDPAHPERGWMRIDMSGGR